MIPAITLVLIPLFFLYDEPKVDDESGTVVGELTVEEINSTLDVALPTNVAIIEAAELDTGDNDPPMTWASLMTFTPELQQSLLVPQHHVWLSAFPVHGVTCAFPPVCLEDAQISRHFPDA
jgi:hypothetical protein